ncbi:DUF1552 domain-containing protein [Nevskia soli]|uniref:DUF1552 domain-containing protein n=1 Tax=Nevskia soli TaxID=418856 RepID=UPI0015D880A6|nr:DUF1552 domain-containing protein [Nevskia soli]
MILTQKALARRTFLRGAGVALALPLLDAMVPALKATSLTAARPVTRLGFVYVPNGIIQKGWLPSKVGTGFEFASTIQPLEPFRDKMLVLSNLMQNGGRALGDGAGDHARAGATWLTGVHPKRTGGADIRAGISADQVAAREFSKQTQFGSLEIGLEEPNLAGDCDSGYSCAYTNTISWRTPTTPNPMEVNPRAVFERLFGDGETTDPKARLKMMSEERSLLDFVRGDVARLQPTLGSRDKSKLDEYLEGIRDIERRIQKAEQQSTMVQVPLIDRPSGIPDEFEEHAKLMSDLMVMAYQTDMTRVVSFMMAREGSNRSYRSIGVPDGHHSVTHHQNDPEKIAKTMKIDALHVKTFSYLVSKMDSTPDGDGTLLDHTMLLFGSSISDGNAHTHHDLPLVLLGGKSVGIHGGRHIRYAPETPMNNLLLTMLDKAGIPAETLGDATGELDQLSGV